MVVQHLARVHTIDVVGAEHQDIVRALVVDQIQVLEDRVGGAGEPARAAAHLGRDRGHVVVEHRAQPPRLSDVAVKAVALVLRQDDDLEEAGVDQIREREIDQAVRPPERDRGLRPIGRKGEQSFALAAREDHRQSSHGALRYSLVILRPQPKGPTGMRDPSQAQDDRFLIVMSSSCVHA